MKKREEQQLLSQLKILFVDDHVGLRDCMTESLKKKESSFEFVCANDYETCIEALKEHGDIKVVILDLNLNGKSGLDIIPEIKKISPKTSILIYTMFNDPIHVENSLLTGIQGYITKDATIDELAVAILSVAKGNSYFNKIAADFMQTFLGQKNNFQEIKNDLDYLFYNYKALSAKEREVFILLSQGMSIADIAKKLGKSEKTVINQRTAVYSKLFISDRYELIEKAKLLGFIL